MELIKLALRENSDPIDAIDALHQIQHIKAAFALIETTIGTFHFLLPSYLDKKNRIYWGAILEDDSIEFIATKFETSLAGAKASISMARYQTTLKSPVKKSILDSMRKIISQNKPRDFNLAYWSFADSLNLKRIDNPFIVMKEFVKTFP